MPLESVGRVLQKSQRAAVPAVVRVRELGSRRSELSSVQRSDCRVSSEGEGAHHFSNRSVPLREVAIFVRRETPHGSTVRKLPPRIHRTIKRCWHGFTEV